MSIRSVPVLAPATLVLSAALWGTTWYPFRLLAARGIDGLWAMVLTEIVAMAVCWFWFGKRLRGMGGRPLLWIGLLGGACNTGYVVGAIQGEVMRVTLLLYLAPLWTVAFAHWLLGERLDRRGAVVIALSLSGALTMLWPGEGSAAPSSADLWGLMAGICYAAYNVLVRRHLELSVPHKTFAGAAGSAVFALAAMPLLGVEMVWSPVFAAPALGLIASLGVVLVLIVALMQYGLERLPASRASVILVSELVFATLSAWWLAHEVPSVRALMGGALVLTASVVAAYMPDRTTSPNGAR